MFWDCQCSVWDSECLSAKSDTSSLESFAEMATRVTTNAIPDFPLYLELVCLYNNRDLTYTDDRLRATTAVLKHFCRNYPGGMISGLPRLFLDPERRGHESSNLPSWAWCGLKCTVDPSLIPGLEEYPVRYGDSYRIRNLVQWSVISEDGTQEEAIEEPRMLDAHKALADKQHYDTVTCLKNGWIRSEKGTGCEDAAWKRYRDTGNWDLNLASLDRIFFHPLDPAKRHFRHPFPIGKIPAKPIGQNLWPHLACTTTSATFRVNAIYTPTWHDGLLTPCAVMKTSVFDLPMMAKESTDDDICRVASLVTSSGDFAGLVRLMAKETNINIQESIELLDISTGSASASKVFDQCDDSIL
ncbi:hypothetical protein QBC38DRAFT_505372 [Podospora fimiseda]|uniref:Uncharacterized protein n=1 Tax=Podospora fimiseda TaxID=252190 RepID=A0AAN7BGE3_9PEZI|nr:hypothetical protein QBC38DRAFT_505372 [Podospora fimiseda]